MHRRHFLATTLGATLAAGVRAADTPTKLRVGVIGHTGRGNYGHGLDTMWLSLPETEIVAVADADPAGLAAAQERLKVARGFADFRAMIADAKPDLVAVCPRVLDEHHAMTMAAIAGGARGIYIEKPFCRALAEADEIVAAADRTRTRIAIAHRNRYHPALPLVSRLVQGGEIGRLLELRARGKEDARGGALDLWVLGTHLLNLVTFFTGKPLACSATVLHRGRPITRADLAEGAEGVGPLAGSEVHARFETESGVPAFFDSIANAGEKSAGFGLQLLGTRGIIDLRMDTEPFAQILAGNPFSPVKDARAWVPISTAGIGQPEPAADLHKRWMGHQLSGADLIQAVREGRDPLCSAAAARTTIEMVSAVFESHRLGGARVALPLAARDNPLTRLAPPGE